VITTASHELRTPVAAIFGAARTLDRADGIDEELRDQLLGVISRESERLARITSDMLTTEALASGTLVTRKEPVELAGLLRDMVAAARARMPDAAIELRDGLPVRVAADPMRLQQVVGNLLDNAIKYSPGGEPIEVDVDAADDVVRIAVADRGIGIPAESRERVFQRFYRVDPELRRGVGGSGLGLFISRELVEAMGGSIAVEPNEPRGTRFVVSLQRA
jgi:two-component system phosphate regulon sensor histidine kinase PhoR